MLPLVRRLARLCELIFTCPYRAAHFIFGTLFNSRLGRLRPIMAPVTRYALSERMLEAPAYKIGMAVKPSLTLSLLFMAGHGQAP
jgi:hypothetical protein